MVKIYTKIRLDIDTWDILEEESFGYEGPLALCGGMGADSDGPGGADTGNDNDYGGGWGLSGTPGQGQGDYGGTIGEGGPGYGNERGGVGDDPTVGDPYGSGFPGFGSQYSPGTAQINDQPDIMQNWAGEIMSRVAALVTAFAALVGFKGAVDPLATYDVFQDIFSKLMGGRWTSYSYAMDFQDTISFGGTDTSGNDSVLGPEEISKIAQAQVYNNAIRAKKAAESLQSQASQLNQQQTQQWATPQQTTSIQKQQVASIWSTDEVTGEPTAYFQTGDIMMQDPYVAINFPPPIPVDMYTQPKTSIWYT